MQKEIFVLLIVLENATQLLKYTLSDEWKSNVALFLYSLFLLLLTKKFKEIRNGSGKATSIVTYFPGERNNLDVFSAD